MTVEGLFGGKLISAGRVVLIFFSARTSGEARCTTKINAGTPGVKIHEAKSRRNHDLLISTKQIFPGGHGLLIFTKQNRPGIAIC